MRSLYESILDTEDTIKSNVDVHYIEHILNSEATTKGAKELNKFWKKLGLDLPKCKWNTRESYINHNKFKFEYVYQSENKKLILPRKNVICKEDHFDDNIGDERVYKMWIDKIKSVGIKIIEDPKSKIWNIIEF